MRCGRLRAGSTRTRTARSPPGPRGGSPSSGRLELLHGVGANARDRQLLAHVPRDARDLVEGDLVEQRDRVVGVNVLAIQDRLLRGVARDGPCVFERDRTGAGRVGARTLYLVGLRSVLTQL